MQNLQERIIQHNQAREKYFDDLSKRIFSYNEPWTDLPADVIDHILNFYELSLKHLFLEYTIDTMIKEKNIMKLFYGILFNENGPDLIFRHIEFGVLMNVPQRGPFINLIMCLLPSELQSIRFEEDSVPFNTLSRFSSLTSLKVSEIVGLANNTYQSVKQHLPHLNTVYTKLSMSQSEVLHFFNTSIIKLHLSSDYEHATMENIQFITQNYTNLVELSIKLSDHVTTVDVTNLSKLTFLKLFSYAITPKITSIKAPPSLKQLDLNGIHVSSNDFIPTLAQLDYIRLSRSVLEGDYTQLAETAKLKRFLAYHECMNVTLPLGHISTLEELFIMEWKTICEHDEYLDKLLSEGAPLQHKLKSLWIPVEASDNIIKRVSQWQSNLELLVLNGEMPLDCSESISELDVMFPKLRKIAGCCIANDDDAMNLIFNTKLTSLEMKNCVRACLTPKVPEMLSMAYRTRGMDLTRVRLTSVEIGTILEGTPCLERLAIEDVDLDDSALQAVKNHPRLMNLRVRNCDWRFIIAECPNIIELRLQEKR
jgi:hypothetical protein